MPRVKGKSFETFGDGLLVLCEAKERKLVRTKGILRYGLHTVGFSRFYKAKVLSESIDMMAVVPRGIQVNQGDVCMIEGEQFSVSLAQDKFDARPPCLLLTLKRLPIVYKDVRENGKESKDFGTR